MKELSLNILDVAMNSVKANADSIEITIGEDDTQLEITISDNGCGMTGDQLERLSDPFFTTRTTRKVGLGIPFYRLAAEQTGGKVVIESVLGAGTRVYALFYKKHIDFTPLGDIISTVLTLIQGYPDIGWIFYHNTGKAEVSLSVPELKEVLGDVPLNSFEVLDWIKSNLEEQYNNII